MINIDLIEVRWYDIMVALAIPIPSLALRIRLVKAAE